MDLKTEILELSRQAQIGPLSPWLEAALDARIADGTFVSTQQLQQDKDAIVAQLADYRQSNGVAAAVIGMSGGVDSALTAALFKAAGWTVHGYTLPIEQNPRETELGENACHALGISHSNIDLTPQYQCMLDGLAQLEPGRGDKDDHGHRLRRGNIRARLRMATLYDQAHRHSGVVASTDNFSELGAGFWTLHGDVGDVAPIQSFLKSWEVPCLARASGVPEDIWRATPTDGLGISAGDEAQIGTSYLGWDLMVLALMDAAQTPGATRDTLPDILNLGDDAETKRIFDLTYARLSRTGYKRNNPHNLPHPRENRYDSLAKFDAFSALS